MKKIFFPVITEFDMNLPYYFDGVGYCYEQENINRPCGHPNYQWIQCRSGKGELYLGTEKHTIEKGQGMFLFPNEPHQYHALEDNWKVDWIIFSGTDVAFFAKNVLKINTSQVCYIGEPTIISDKLYELYNTAASETPTRNMICSSIVYSILMDILRLTSPTENTSITNKFNRLIPVLSYIDNNYNRQLSLLELSEIANLTPQYLCSIFKKLTSQTLFEYINMLRIKKSKELLLSNKEIQIKEVAHKVGFDDVSYFCAIFRKFEKMSPTEFRSPHNQNAEHE